jgi:threonine/homoserine/homoserine lactone efflux protein
VQALLGNVLNLKAASIYLTLVPQFLIPDQPVFGQVLLLATAHAILIVVWLLTWTLVIGKAAALVRSATFKPMLNRVTGAMLVALGVKSALA